MCPPRGPLECSHFHCMERISILRAHILLAAVTPVTRLQAVLQDLSWGTSAMRNVSEAFSHR